MKAKMIPLVLRDGEIITLVKFDLNPVIVAEVRKTLAGFFSDIGATVEYMTSLEIDLPDPPKTAAEIAGNLAEFMSGCDINWLPEKERKLVEEFRAAKAREAGGR